MKSKTDLARGWFAKATSDLAAAETLLSSHGSLDAACFHAQQGIEKVIKAFLAYHDQEIPRTHDLELLQNLCLEIQD